MVTATGRNAIRTLLARFAFAEWLEKELCNASVSDNDTVVNDWLRLAITTWALTACNHDGDTTAARVYSDKLDVILPSVTGRWGIHF